MRISLPKGTDPTRTYQWRFLLAIAEKFDEWDFDDITAKKFISIAVGEAKRRGLLNKGLAALHQSNMLNICYQIMISQQKDNNIQIKSLESIKNWFDNIVGDNDPFKILMFRRSQSLPNIILWYQASKLSDLYLSLSKVCGRVISHINDPFERRLLPTTTSLYLLRSDFLSERNNLESAKQLFGSDWRKS